MNPLATFGKTPTGIPGLDEITGGGLPAGRSTLVCGAPGSGKTLLGATFLVHGAVRYNEPGVLMSFEENAQDLADDVASLGFDLPRLTDEKKIVIDYVQIDRSEIEETGEYDLDGLFVRLEHAAPHRARSPGPRHQACGAVSPDPGLDLDGLGVEELRARLREAEDALRAIRLGRNFPESRRFLSHSPAGAAKTTRRNPSRPASIFI